MHLLCAVAAAGQQAVRSGSSGIGIAQWQQLGRLCAVAAQWGRLCAVTANEQAQWQHVGWRRHVIRKINRQSEKICMVFMNTNHDGVCMHCAVLDVHSFIML
jgi:hypothetical protein